MKSRILSCFVILFSIGLQAQEVDSIPAKKDFFSSRNTIEEVVITGQYNPQSVDKSVMEVNVLSEEDIKMLAGNNLADVLTQTLNMNVAIQGNDGSSGISQFGFNSEYVKILVDNVPLIGDEGFGNAIDISQINLDDIERIEIVEGSMGVQYGSNAVTGVVNIITKKKANQDWQIRSFIQEETIGNEYGLFEEGRHIQSIKIGHNISDHWYANILFTRNDFQGFKNNLKGIDYYNPEQENDSLRGFQWLPKEQNTIKSLIRYSTKNVQVFYKFEYFDELTERYANSVLLNRNPATATVHPTAQDTRFRTNRMYHHLNASGRFSNQITYNISAAYQEQKQNVENFTYYLKTKEEQLEERYDYNTRKGFFSRGTFANFMTQQDWDVELGYELNIDEGSASGLSLQDITKRTQQNTLKSYAFFASTEISPVKNLSLRPGIRTIISSQFAPQYPLSLSASYRFKNNYQLRAVVGTAPKIPNFEELYYYMVDSNHDIQGNQNLNPENGKSVFIHFKKAFWFQDYSMKFLPKLSAWFLDVDDKIDLTIRTQTPLSYQYNNIDVYRTWGMALRNNFQYNQIRATVGFGFSGESKVLYSAEVYNDDYLYGIQANANLSYQIPEWNTTLATFFKYNGPQYQFVRGTNEDGETVLNRTELEGYSWWNASVRKTFLDKTIDVTLGVRNLLDVTAINSSSGTGATGGHSSGNSSLLLGYGRSYFIKLLYNLNF